MGGGHALGRRLLRERVWAEAPRAVAEGQNARLWQAGPHSNAFQHAHACTQRLSRFVQADKYGSTYEGQYFAGKKEGQGCLVYFNGDK